MPALLTGAAESFKKSSARWPRGRAAPGGRVFPRLLSGGVPVPTRQARSPWPSRSVLVALPASAQGNTPSRPIQDLLHLTEGRCLRRSSLAAGVASWLSRDTIAESITIDAEEFDGGGRFVLRRDGELLGRRTLLRADSSCEELRAALSLAIAVAIDATILDALGAAPSPAPTLPAPPPSPRLRSPAAIAASTAGVARAPAEASAARFAPSRLSASLEIGVLAGLLPAPAFLISPSLSYAIALPFEVRLAAVATSSADAALISGGASLRIAAARLDACALERRAPFVLRVCAGALAGGLSAAGFSYSRSFAPTSPWIAFAGRIDARWAPRGGASAWSSRSTASSRRSPTLRGSTTPPGERWRARLCRRRAWGSRRARS